MFKGLKHLSKGCKLLYKGLKHMFKGLEHKIPPRRNYFPSGRKRKSPHQKTKKSLRKNVFLPFFDIYFANSDIFCTFATVLARITQVEGLKKLIALAVAVPVLMACSASADDYINIYESGTDEVGEALTKQKLARITFDVQDEVKDLQNRIGHKKNLSAEDYQRIFDAQNKFYDAVEKRDKELSR